MNQPAYLWKNDRGIYFFRARIPKQFSAHFNSAEIKKSLKTDSLRFAVKLARAYRVELDKEMEKLEQGVYSAFAVALEGRTKVTLPNGEEKIITGKIEREIASPDDAIKHKEYLLKQLREEADRQEKQARENALFEAQLAAISPAIVPQSKSANIREALLSVVINEFIKAKIADGKWDASPEDSTHQQGCTRLAQLLEIIGDKPSIELTELDALKVEETLPNTPSHPNKGLLAKLPNLQAKIETDPSIYPRLSKSTQSKYWTLFTELIKFAKQKKYIDIDIAGNCRGIKFSKKEAKASQWRKLTNEDLQSIFNGHVYQSEKRARTRRHDYHFWLPLLAAYTGARINELSQLLLTDIKQYQDIWYIDITDQDEEGRKIQGKNVKSDAGRRKVPIHSKLIDLGFLEFIQQPRIGDNANMVFTTGLSFSKSEKWGKNPSRWFNGYEGHDGYKQMCGISGDDKKVFHSFRKSFAANLINHTNVERLAQLIGHEQEYKTTFIYAGEIDLSTLKNVIEKLDYQVNLSHVNFQTFKSIILVN